MVGVDWWDAVGCTQSAAECGIGKHLNCFKNVMCHFDVIATTKCSLSK